jgi:hypothetical protein
VLSPLLYSTQQSLPSLAAYPPARYLTTLVNRFVIVVGGSDLVNIPETVDTAMNTSLYHGRVIDILDTFNNTWYRDVLRQTAGSGEFVASVGEIFAVFGGSDASSGYYQTLASIDVYKWTPTAYKLLDCAVISDCQTCVINTTQNTVRTH